MVLLILGDRTIVSTNGRGAFEVFYRDSTNLIR